MKSVFHPLLCLLAILFYTAPALAQEGQINEDDNKVIIITKTIDENGEEVVKRIEKTNDELNGNHFNFDLDEEGLHNININVNVEDGKKMIQITGTDEDGEDIDIYWEGDGEVPEEIQERLHHKGLGKTLHPHHGVSMHHRMAADDRGFLGVVMGKKVENINGVENTTGESEAGVVIERVVPNSAAEQSGLAAGDLITAINGQRVQTIAEVSEAIGAHKAGENIEVTYTRGEVSNTQEITLKSRADRPGKRSFHWIDDEDQNFDFDFDYDYDFDFEDMHDMSMRPPCKPFIGVYLNLSGEEETGIAVQRIIPNTPAAEVALQSGDLITAIDDIAVSSHSELVKERNKHEAGDNFTLTFIRDGLSKTVNATFPACDQEVIKSPGQHRVIIIKKKKDEEVEEEEVPENINMAPQDLSVVPESFLSLENFSAFPNPSEGLVTLQFEAAPNPIVVRVTDITGKEIFRDAINNFDGIYNRQLDLTEASGGTLLLSITQEGQVFTDKLIRNNENRP